MRFSTVVGVGIVAFVFVAGCADTSAPASTLAIRTSQSRYLLAPAMGLFVSSTLTNVSAQPVVLSACLSFVIPVPEHWTGREWEARRDAICGNNDLIAALGEKTGRSSQVEARNPLELPSERYG